MPTTDPIITCRKLEKHYARGGEAVRVLESIDLSLARGAFVALMGPSGSGKTTLLNLFAGIDRPTAGSLVVDGQDLVQLSRAELAKWRAEKVGYVFQLYHLVPVLTAYENVELPLYLHDLSRSERHRRVEEALEAVGIADRHAHYPRQLSGGQEQRVAIARAIVTRPALLLADEPTGDLDRVAAASIMTLLSSLHRQRGQTIVMVTHDPATASHAQRLVHLDKGKLVEDAAVRA
ncbi:MAG: ABC transporter ATP-binding protein [Planctomycetes bacterium]|nr:ABC transporter ATP-binding protein [Planctomycetota bacterium]